MPMIGNIARPASDEHRATQGTATKNGVDRNVSNDAQPSSPMTHQT
jgi:hypothetical protein